MTRLPGRLVVISGPSGSGKTTICRALAARDDVELSVSATTRAKRKGEVEGRDYYYLTPEEFEARLARGEFLESAAYNGKRYGTLKNAVEAQRRHVPVVILEIEVQGTMQLRESGIDAIYIFVMPPSLAELDRRLHARKTEDQATIRRRLEIAREEMDMAHLYDHVVINEDLDATIRQVSALIGFEEDRPEADGAIDVEADPDDGPRTDSEDCHES